MNETLQAKYRGMEKIIVSCIPVLTEAQQKGMLRLLHDLKAQGYEVYFWSHNQQASLSDFKPGVAQTEIKGITKIRYVINYLKAWLFTDRKKWIARLGRWLNLNDKKELDIRYKDFVREGVKLFSGLKPSLFVCWNPYCCQFGIAGDVAKILGISVSAIEWGYLPDSFLLDKKGTLAGSEIFNCDPTERKTAEEKRLYRATGERAFNQLKTSSLSLYVQQSIRLPEGLVNKKANNVNLLLIGIDEIDAGAYPEDHPDRSGLLPFHESSFDQARAFARADRAFRVVYKPHPSHNRYSEDSWDQANLWIINGNPDQLIDWADVIVCSGSKMEFSALLRRKPLINVGAGLLYKKGCSYEVTRPEQMKDMVITAYNNGVKEEQLDKFKEVLGFLEIEYLYSYDDKSNNALMNFLSKQI